MLSDLQTPTHLTTLFNILYLSYSLKYYAVYFFSIIISKVLSFSWLQIIFTTSFGKATIPVVVILLLSIWDTLRTKVLLFGKIILFWKKINFQQSSSAVLHLLCSKLHDAHIHQCTHQLRYPKALGRHLAWRHISGTCYWIITSFTSLNRSKKKKVKNIYINLTVFAMWMILQSSCTSNFPERKFYILIQ